MTTFHATPEALSPLITPKAAAARYRIKLSVLFPPVIVDLREDHPSHIERPDDALTDKELAYFKRNGNNATVFIHGFDVPWGAFGEKLLAIDQVRAQLLGPFYAEWFKPIYSNAATVYRNRAMLSKRFPLLAQPDFLKDEVNNNTLNGTGMHNWAVYMEDNLNRAAGFNRQAQNYTLYQRLIHIAWSGDVVPWNYIQAEINATRAGVRLARTLKQLIRAGLSVNLIAHSLGNRVLLVALNELGKSVITENQIEHAFLWQAAIPDTALSNDPAKDTSVLGNWQRSGLVNAWKGAKRLIVLYSREDNILGPATPADMKEDCTAGRDGRENETECMLDIAEVDGPVTMNGLYGAATRGVTIHAGLLYDAITTWGFLFPQGWTDIDLHTGAPVYDKQHGFYWNRKDWQEGWRRLAARQRRTYESIMAQCQTNDPTGHRACRTEGVQAAHQIQPRPAMGWNGPLENQADPFIQALIKSKKIIPVDQTRWLYDHSGMRVPTQTLFEKVYKIWIMDRIKQHGGFGRYR